VVGIFKKHKYFTIYKEYQSINYLIANTFNFEIIMKLDFYALFCKNLKLANIDLTFLHKNIKYMSENCTLIFVKFSIMYKT